MMRPTTVLVFNRTISRHRNDQYLRKKQLKDPPARFKGIVSASISNPSATFVTIKVKEIQPTSRKMKSFRWRKIISFAW